MCVFFSNTRRIKGLVAVCFVGCLKKALSIQAGFGRFRPLVPPKYKTASRNYLSHPAMKTPPEKHWKHRKSGIMKAHGKYGSFHAKVALHLERNRELFVYRSHQDFASEDATALARQILTPEDFITLAEERNSRQSQCPSTAGREPSTAAEDEQSMAEKDRPRVCDAWPFCLGLLANIEGANRPPELHPPLTWGGTETCPAVAVP